MSRFEYLSVLVSIVIALGIGEMTISWGRALQLRQRLTFSWLHLFWTLFILFMMVQFWWGFWTFRHVDPWTLPKLLTVLVEAVTLVLAALLIAPRPVESGPVDLHELFFAHSRWFFLLGAALIVQLAITAAAIVDKPFFSMENVFRAPGVALALVAAWTTNLRFHYSFAGAAALLLAGFLLFSIEM